MKLPELPPEVAPEVRVAFEALARESAELRAELEALKGAIANRPVATTSSVATQPPPRVATAASAATPAPRAAAPQRPPDRRDPAPEAGSVRSMVTPAARSTPGLDMEKLLGRYGAWAAAALMILLGVGTLLEWAIRNGLFGPGARVALSTVIAVVLAVGGYVLRERADAAGESRSYGNSCLGLALGVVDVIAWQIGPHWRMVPASLALLLADVGAAALVTFGVLEQDELLAAIGAAGLYLAPFVTSTRPGSPLVLATYVVLVSLALFRFVEQPAWRVARAVVRWGPILSTFALIGMEEPVLGAIVASALAMAMLAVDTPVVARLTTIALYIATAIMAAFAVALDVHTASAALAVGQYPAWLASLALGVVLVAVSVFALRVAVSEDVDAATAHREGALRTSSPLSITFTLLLPLGVVLAAAGALAGDATLNATWLSGAMGVIALAVALLSAAPLARDYYTTGFVLLWTGALAWSSRGARVSEAMLLGVTVVALGIAALRRDVRIARTAAFVSPAWVAAVSATWMYTAESQPVARPWLDVALMLGACCALAWIAREDVDAERTQLRAVRTLAAWGAALLLARHLVVVASGAYAAVGLTAFYAAAGVMLIVLGGRRESVGMRRAGLALSLYAPLRAIATASGVDNTGTRVAVYFVAGMFMLLVAFLYRSRARDGEPILADVGSAK